MSKEFINIVKKSTPNANKEGDVLKIDLKLNDVILKRDYSETIRRALLTADCW